MKQKSVNIQEGLNKCIFEGSLPVAFFNSIIIKNENRVVEDYKNLNKKYLQLNIPRGNCGLVISKIYEIS